MGRLVRRLERLGGRLLEVPGDGNCLLWSFQWLLLGGPIPSPKVSQNWDDMLALRQSLKTAWLERKDDKVWQQLFSASYGRDVNRAPKKNLKHEPKSDPCQSQKVKMEVKREEQIPVMPTSPCQVKPEIPPSTPPRKKPKVVKCQIDLITPERPEPPFKKLRVDDARPAQICKPVASKEPALRVPGQNGKRPAFVEPLHMDVEDAYSKMKMQIGPADVKAEKHDPQNTLVADVGCDVADVDELVLAEEPTEQLVVVPTKQTRAKHARSCHKKEPTPIELESNRLRMYLSKKLIVYGSFKKCHARFCQIATAGACSDGGWLQFQNRLRLQKPPKCNLCLQMMSAYGIKMEEVAKVVAGSIVSDPVVVCSPVKPPSQEEKAESQMDQIVAQSENEETTEMDEYQKCVQFVESFGPHIELATPGENEKGYRLAYRCRLCTSRGHPHGKLNSLVKPSLKYVQRFLLQHVNGPSHQQKLSALQNLNEKVEEEKAACSPCPGLRVSDASAGSLHHYVSEFAMWAAHSNLTNPMCKNKIWCDVSANEWFARHSKCVTNMPHGMTCCSFCQSLAEPSGLQRTVVHFACKHAAARLLNAKLFCTKTQVDELLSEIDDSAVGQRHAKFWKKLQTLNLVELQKYVRNGFLHLDAFSTNDTMKAFVSSTVVPCTSVNATSISSKLPALSMQFANALVNRDLTELESLSLNVSSFAVHGRLDSNPLLQGLLVQCMSQIERQEQGKSSRGRKKEMSATERQLAQDSAITLSMMCRNRQLAQSLGQSVQPPRIIMEELATRSLPNPMLSLHSAAKSQLLSNFQFVDQLCPRSPQASPRRLICAIDHTYLVKSFSQASWNGKVGLAGGFWSPSDEDSSFMPLDNLPKQATERPKANLMLECLLWDPNTSQRRRCYSVASMPMQLKACSCLDSKHPDRMAGNKDPHLISSYNI